MRIWGHIAAVTACAVLVGCVTTEAVRFQATATQSAMVKDGRPAIISRQKNSIVLLEPARRELRSGQRPVFILAASNIGGAPVDLRISAIQVVQTVSGRTIALPVVPYEQLASEERNRQIAGAILVGLAAGANSYSASRAGYGTMTGTVYGPRGASLVMANYYSPTAAAMAQSNAALQNEAMIANHIEGGRARMGALEKNVLKDNTLLPAQWVGGQVHFEPPQGETGAVKEYQVSVRGGPDVHTVTVFQAPRR